MQEQPTIMTPFRTGHNTRWFFFALLLIWGYLPSVLSFTTLPNKYLLSVDKSTALVVGKKKACIVLDAQDNNNNNNFSREVRLREEAESPFQKVRYFFYFSLGGGAMTSLLLSLARIAAAASGINPDLMQESLVNAGIDLAGLVVIGLAFRQDLQAQESRMKRATKGASLAKLAIRVDKALQDPLELESSTKSYVTLTLADLRRNRGIEKRVVIAAAGKEKIQRVLEEARLCADALELNDLLIVPVVMPSVTAPDSTEDLPSCVALPTGNAAWKAVLKDESQQALEQNVDIETEGLCVILKKNGRVGQRTRGIFLERMVGEVEGRRQAGMDVTNI